MISTGYYPYPVNDKSSARRVALLPHIYSPSESHSPPRHAMYPHLYASGCPSPSYIYSYEHDYSKDSWASATPNSWTTFYPFPPRSSSLPETAVNPKVTILPSQPILVSDIDTPSSISSHSVLSPLSPFPPQDACETDLQTMELEGLECEDEEDYIDSDFVDEMEVIDEVHSPLYGTSAPLVIKSTSALEGALGDAPLSLSYDGSTGGFSLADRRLSASVPGYASAPHRSTAASHQRWPEKAHSPLTSSPHVPDTSQHTYTQRNYASSSTSLLAPASPSLYNHISSSSLGGAFTSSTPLSLHASNLLPILQPQPIRPIPPIPLADLASSANECCAPVPPPALSPLPLLCQPVSDAVRYQLKEAPAKRSGALNDDDICHYDQGNTSEAMCEDLIATPENDRFAPQGVTFCQDHPSAGGILCSMGEKMYSCGCIALPIRWQ